MLCHPPSLALFPYTTLFRSYVGGADPFCEDQLGGLSLTKAGLKKRDRSVFEQARRRGIPVATTLAGGYARRVEDTVRIHVNTILAARDRKSTRLNSSHTVISYAVFCLK